MFQCRVSGVGACVMMQGMCDVGTCVMIQLSDYKYSKSGLMKFLPKLGVKNGGILAPFVLFKYICRVLSERTHTCSAIIAVFNSESS